VIPGRIRFRSAIVLGAAASACLTLVAVPVPASADPGRGELTQLLADASHQLEVVSEQINQARTELGQQQAAADDAQRAAADAQGQLTALDGQIRQLARTAYTSNRFSQVQVLLTTTSVDQMIARLGTLNAIAGHQDAAVHQVVQVAGAAQKARAQADGAATAARQTLDRVTAQQARLETQAADYQRRYDALTRAEQEAVSRAVAGPAIPVSAQAADGGQGSPAPAQAPAPRPAQAPAPAVAVGGGGSGAGQAAVATALAQVGKPYSYGAAGPGAFDCSGLTMYAYAAAGIRLPHSSTAQYGMGRPVSRSELQPGDLLFFYSSLSHVAMYVGNGRMVHAATQGTPVQVVDVSYMPSYMGARRLVG
jgi:cell wall-associated NlpC family hydrolase